MEVDMFVTCHHESVTCEVIIATKQNIDYTIIPKKKKKSFNKNCQNFKHLFTENI